MRRTRRPPSSSIAVARLCLVLHVLVCSIPGIFSSRIVSLGSIAIFTTHEWFPTKPIVYFRCQGENKTYLPDVKQKDILYTFNGDESWQPLTELPEKKCKRCGVYEEDTYTSDDVYDEWELCAGNFVNGKYLHSKDNQFNASFICPECTTSDVTTSDATESKNEASGQTRRKIAMIVAACTLAAAVTGAAAVMVYRWWRKRKREQEQARFLKLFEEDDDIEDELGLEL
ncbi:uncharacterized protein LOC122002531 isoform X2 [Zingiber officinale]|uniref:uncharacterized protein LOC122002531 isoform X2 n=1 Tax=Zingiber officinale TaxID=94328 RepID=UPI001C4C8E04|nr:uncharacterized protein LOC122002531 isoform X2 [Zingiber officinale]